MSNPPFSRQLFLSFFLVALLTLLPVAFLLSSTFFIDESQHVSAQSVLLFVFVSLIVGLISSSLLSRRMLFPLKEIIAGSQRFASGTFQPRIYLADCDEFIRLAEALNQLASQAEERAVTGEKQKSENELILSSMIEGVLAVDTEDRLLRMNPAARELFAVSSQSYVGTSIQSVIRNAALHEFLSRAKESGGNYEDEITLHGTKDRTLYVFARAIHGLEKEASGILMVFYDTTNIKRLENIRKDFVANVSHELKTPITSIKGFVETLLDGAMHDKDDLLRFLKIIAQHVERLEAVFRDLLTLSKLEQQGDNGDLELSSLPINDVLQSARDICLPKAREKNIGITLRSGDPVSADINAGLLEQAVVNLLDNAVKFSSDGQEVEVSVFQEGQNVVISVRDSGPGIEPRHAERVFERFYRADASRARKLGGTGLGLAIVKHIAQVHRGYAAVNSKVGEGSVFKIYLPRKQA